MESVVQCVSRKALAYTTGTAAETVYVQGTNGVVDDALGVVKSNGNNAVKQTAGKAETLIINSADDIAGRICVADDLGVSYEGKVYRIYDSNYSKYGSNPRANHRYTNNEKISSELRGKDVYFSDHPYTAFKEARGNEITDLVGKRISCDEIKIDNMLDLRRDANTLEKIGVRYEDVTQKFNIQTNPKAYEVTNIISEKAYQAGYNGIIYPSAQVEGQTNVMLFRDRYSPDNFKKVFDEVIK